MSGSAGATQADVGSEGGGGGDKGPSPQEDVEVSLRSPGKATSPPDPKRAGGDPHGGGGDTASQETARSGGMEVEMGAIGGRGAGGVGAGGVVLVDDIINEIGWGWYQKKLLVLCGAGWAADIMDLQVMAFLLPTLQVQWDEPQSTLSLAPSATFVGMLIGSLVWGVASDRVGRKPAFTATSMWAGTFGMLCASSTGIGSLVLWRFLMGFGLGGNLSVDFSLFMEFVPSNVRGKFTTILTVFATLGSLTTAVLAWAVLDSWGWRAYVLLCSAPGILVGVARSFMEESPHFLAAQGRGEEALAVLQEVARSNGPLAEARFRGVSGGGVGVASDALGRVGGLRELLGVLSHPELRPRLVMMSCSWFALSFGFYGFSVWGPSYFKARGFETGSTYQAITASVLCQLPGTALAALLVESVGRRVLLVAFAVGCLVTVSGVAIFPSHTLMLLFSFALNFCTAALWAITYTHTPEVFPTHVRTTCMGVCSCVARVAGIIVSVMGGSLLATSLEASIGSYAVAYGIVAILSFVMKVDMTGKNLSQASSFNDERSHHHEEQQQHHQQQSESDGTTLLAARSV